MELKDYKGENAEARCLICDASHGWHDVDHLRMKPMGMAMCKQCGFVSYPARLLSQEDLHAYYETDYRKMPNASNYFTGHRKLHYHSAFLSPLLKEWAETASKDSPRRVHEDGSAIGMFLHWLRQTQPEGSIDISGTEWTGTFRRVAWHEYKVPLTVQWDPKEDDRYDMIATYKVAEHMIDVDHKLEQYRKHLKPDGLLYIGVPQWHKMMSNFGVSGYDLEYYYHPDHINVWGRDHFEYLLNRCGFRIERENHQYYDSVYLCRIDESVRERCASVHASFAPGPVIAIMERVKAATVLYEQNKFKEAIETFSAFPLAWQGYYEMQRKWWHEQGWEAIKKGIIDLALEACPDSAEIVEFCASLARRYEQFDLTSELLNLALSMRPSSSGALMAAGAMMRDRAQVTENPEDRNKLYAEAARAMVELQRQHPDVLSDSMSWKFYDFAHLPTPMEARG